MKRLAKLVILPFVVVLLMGADNQEARFQKLGSKIMCTCSCAQMLLKCNHVGCPNSARMILELHTLVSDKTLGSNAGLGAEVRTSATGSRSDEEVLNWFRKNWGVTAVVEPSSHGFELIAWILPPMGLGLGLVLVIALVRSWKVRTALVAPEDRDLNPDLEAFRARAHRETEI